jgi:hypothetical protein
METAKRTAILLSLVLLITGTIQAAGKPKISNSRFASCVVKITANPNVFPLNFGTIESLLRSSSVAGRAGRNVLGLPPERSIEFFGIEPLSRDSADVIPPEPQRMGDDMMMDERMMRMNEQRMEAEAANPRRSGAGIEGGLLGDQPSLRLGRGTGARLRRDRSETRTARGGRGIREDIGLYGEEAMRPRVVAPEPPGPDVEQTLLFRLTVELPEDVKPAAEEFMNVLIDLMRRTILDEARDYSVALQNRLSRIREQRERAQAQLSEMMGQARAIEPPPPIELDPADVAVYEQLEQIVDLLMLSPTMPFYEAIEKLKNSVDPPLKIVVLWRDLLDSAEIEQATEINMDGIPGVRLGTALELLLKAVSDGFAELGYVVKNGVITVATKDALPNKLETRVYDIPGLGYPAGGVDNLIQLIQDTIEPDSWFDIGIRQGTISTYMGRKLAILQTPEIHRKIQNFLQTIKVDIPVDIPMDVPLEPLLDEKHDLLRDKRVLEMDVARMEARHTAIEEQIAKMSNEINTKVEDDPVTRELQEIVDMYSERCSKFEKLVSEGGRVSSPELESEMSRLVQAKKELAKRRGELSRSAGGDQLARFNNELADIMIELAEKRAELGVVDKQLKQIEGQLTMATTFDPQVSQIRIARQTLENAGRRVNELETFLAGLQEPTITVLGVD